MNFYLGCAVWSYKDWVGNLYPPHSKSQDFLNLYSHRFTAVESNSTFYALPSAATIEKWIEQTPVSFKFCPKFSRTITHQGLLSPFIPDALNFLSRISSFGDRLGTTFIQLPPSYGPEYIADLTEFLQACSQSGLSLALEVRHLNWFQQNHNTYLNSLLTQLNIARVLLDTRPIYDCPDDPQLGSPRKKPQVPLQSIITGDTGFIRFISHPDQKYNQSYLEQWASDINNWLEQEKTIYFFVHCPQEVNSPKTAKYFQSLLEQKNFSLSRLPWNMIEPYPQQLSLF
ncbi:DUF72 domain-containing protein [Pleurocapsa sp. PCC 7319]|uniref:DUF72 domain-containing protein n=1 Tax=Pleurocapsa sp. PCC 7319 TaxID=118161 RepID=UPI00034B0387|nr:DUF72 domain-containing protein [Pleurocapsa sp. PCC 7319]